MVRPTSRTALLLTVVGLLIGAMLVSACAGPQTPATVQASQAATATTAAAQPVPGSTTSTGEDPSGMFVEPKPETVVHAEVFDVIDGDSLVVVLHLGEGQREEVRLIGIDAPEAGEPFADEARTALEAFTKDPEVRLETGAEMRDQYGRLLAYVFAGTNPASPDILINSELLRQGLATVYTVPPNVKYLDGLEQAQAEAQAAKAGMWAATKASPLEIARVEYNPPGDDTVDLNLEYIVFQVLVTGSLRGYAVEDESGKHFDLPNRVYEKGQTITLHSGQGANTASDLYWGVSGSAIWDNDGDTVKVLDPQGHIVASLTY